MHLCDTCSFECRSCVGSSINNCTSCAAGRFFQPSLSACVVLCNEGFYENATDNLCYNCHASCVDCIGPLDSNCVKCATGQFLNPNLKCLENCPAGLYGDASENKCKFCEPSCLTCTAGSSSNCTACPLNSGRYLTSDQQCL